MPRYSSAAPRHAQAQGRDDAEDQAAVQEQGQGHAGSGQGGSRRRRGSCRRGFRGGIRSCGMLQSITSAGGQQVERRRPSPCPATDGAAQNTVTAPNTSATAARSSTGFHRSAAAGRQGVASGAQRGKSPLQFSARRRVPANPDRRLRSRAPSTGPSGPAGPASAPGPHVAQREGGPQPEQRRAAAGPGQRHRQQQRQVDSKIDDAGNRQVAARRPRRSARRQGRRRSRRAAARRPAPTGRA